MRKPVMIAAACLVAFAAHAQEPDQTGPEANADAARKFAAWDADGDGRISPAEWKGPPARFSALDGDGDGALSLDEFTRAGKGGKRPQATENSGENSGEDRPSCAACQDKWSECMVGKPGSRKHVCDEAMMRCQSKCGN